MLNSILTKALEYSLHGDTHLAGNFTFALRYLPETFHPHAPDSLNCLELRYKVGWGGGSPIADIEKQWCVYGLSRDPDIISSAAAAAAEDKGTEGRKKFSEH